MSFKVSSHLRKFLQVFLKVSEVEVAILIQITWVKKKEAKFSFVSYVCERYYGLTNNFTR